MNNFYAIRPMRVLIALFCALCLATASFAAPLPLPATRQSLAMQKLERAFLQREVRDAYGRIGRRNPKWDEPAGVFLDRWIDWSVARYATPKTADLLELSQKAIDAGCDDAIVRYCRGCVLREAQRHFDAAHAFRFAYEGLQQSEYDVSFRCWAAQQLADEVIAAGFAGEAEPYLAAKRSLLRDVVTKANYKEHEVRLLFRDLTADFEDRPIAEIEANWNAVRKAKMAPWLAQCLEGKVEFTRAYTFRSGLIGTAKSDPKNVQTFAANMSKAREHFMAAWELDHTMPEPANSLMAVTRMEDGAMADVRTWFDNARSADFDYYPPYTQLRYAMQTSWDVPHEEMVAKGREFVGSNRFDTVVPFTMMEFALPTIPGVDQPYEPIRAAGAYDDLVAMAEGYLAEPSMGWTHDWMRSFLVALAWRCERWDDAAKYLAALQGEPDADAFLRLGVHVDEGIGEIVLRTGPLASGFSEAESLAKQGDVDRAVESFVALREQATHPRVAIYLDHRLALLRRLQDFRAGAWVNLLPEKNLRGWWVSGGAWSVSDQGALIGKSDQNGMLLVRNEKFDGDVTLEGRVRFVDSKYAGHNAGVFFGEPWGRYRQVFSIRRSTAFTFYEDKDYASLSIGDVEHREDLQVDDKVSFRVERRGDKLTTYVGDRRVHDATSLNVSDATQDERLAIGGYYWYPGTVLEFQQLRIRANPK